MGGKILPAAVFAPPVPLPAGFLYRKINRLIAPFRLGMARNANFACAGCNGFGALALYASLKLHQQGRHCRGPCLEAECDSSVRRIRFRRRDLAGGILSSSGRRRRQTKLNEQAGRRSNTTPESEESSPVFCFSRQAHCAYARRAGTTQRPNPTSNTGQAGRTVANRSTCARTARHDEFVPHSRHFWAARCRLWEGNHGSRFSARGIRSLS
jgi:hypothetical protein